MNCNCEKNIGEGSEVVGARFEVETPAMIPYRSKSAAGVWVYRRRNQDGSWTYG